METDLPLPCSSGSSDLPDFNQPQNTLLPLPSSSATTQIMHYGSNVSSTSASPGPLKRFRQTYASEIRSEPSSKPISNHYTQNWVQNYHCSAYPQSYSSTPSVMSCTSVISKASAVSVQTELSVLTDMNCAYINLPNLPISTQYSSRASTSSFAENMDPNFYQVMDNYLLSIIDKLSSTNERELLETLYSLNEVAKKRKFVYCKSPEKIIRILYYLFYILTMQQPSLKTINVITNTLHEITCNRECMDAFRTFMHQTNGAPIPAICSFLNPNEKYGNYATNVLHTLLFNDKTSNISKYYARREDTVLRLMNTIQSPNCTYKHIALDALQILLRGSADLRAYFKRNNGVEMCLKIMVEEGEERILYRNILVIGHLLNDNEIGDYFLDCGGIQIIGNHLDHGSPRLLANIAKCLSTISDSTKLATQNIDSALERVIQILGSTDMDLVYHATGFMANAQRNNIKAKIFLHDNNAIENLMCLMRVCSESKFANSAHKQKIFGVLENVLIALNNLTGNYGAEGGSYVLFACARIMNQREIYDVATVFLNVLSMDYISLGSRTIFLLNRIAENIPDATSVLQYAVDKVHHLNYAHHLMNILFWAAEECWKETRNFPECELKSGRANKCEIMIKRTLTFLINITRHNIFFNNQIATITMGNKNLVMLLPYLNRNLKLELMSLLMILIENPEQRLLADAWASNQRIYEILREYSLTTVDPSISQKATLLLNRIGFPLVT